MAHPKRNLKQLAQLGSASLEVLMEDFPEAWQAVGQQLVDATSTRRPEAIEAFVRAFQEAAAPYEQRVGKSGKNPQVLATALPFLVRKRMAMLAAQRTLHVAALGAGAGRRRFGLWSGFLVQRLFFERGLVRKPVSMRAFRWLWPWVTQKRLLVPLVQPRGMYAFYSRELVAALAELVDHRPALEIAAGDGCLSAFLNHAGTTIRATDDHSWSHNIRYPDAVERLDAGEALERHRPEVVLCSYPPPKNAFEAAVFKTASVDLYIVITTRHKFAAGDWQTYESQTDFAMQADSELSRLILPPEIDPLLLIFRRRQQLAATASTRAS
jgi:hypothetical protein